MEKILKAEFKKTRTSKSKLILDTVRDDNKKCIYQARCVGYEYNEQGYYHKTENGTLYLIAYTKSGEAILEYEGEETVLKAGSLIFLNLANKRVIKVLKGHWEIYFMHVYGSDTSDIYKTVASSEKGYFFETFEGEKIMERIMHIYDIYTGSEIDHCEISAEIYAVLMQILKNSKPLEKSEIIRKALLFINTNYTSQITVDDISKSVFSSKYFFIRKFHQEVGVSPKQYLMKLRVENAKTLLVQTGKAVNEIAILVGFENEKNINYAFKKVLGITPRQYRENY